ncbi:MAG: alpha/beta hydrolase [Bacteroidales bacterium]
MKEKQNSAPFVLNGRWQYRLRSLINLNWSTFYITLRRLFKGARFPNWSWSLETSMHFLKTQTDIAFDMPNHADGREYQDSLLFKSSAIGRVNIETLQSPVKGHWYEPKSEKNEVTLLYLHGGGYTYYSKAHENIIALVTLAASSRTFAPDYRLTPEHPFPAQLEDALAAYRWLLDTGIVPEQLVIAGDSAGGNLTLTLLLAIRNAGLPFPAGAICIAPWTDLSNPGESMRTNDSHDWITERMAKRWADWFCQGKDASNPLISPVHADLKGLPPIYIQAGSAEILYDMICVFEKEAKKQGADVTLDVWPNMIHDFQAFGDLVTESREALQRIGEMVVRFTSIKNKDIIN